MSGKMNYFVKLRAKKAAAIAALKNKKSRNNSRQSANAAILEKAGIPTTHNFTDMKVTKTPVESIKVKHGKTRDTTKHAAMFAPLNYFGAGDASYTNNNDNAPRKSTLRNRLASLDDSRHKHSQRAKKWIKHVFTDEIKNKLRKKQPGNTKSGDQAAAQQEGLFIQSDNDGVPRASSAETKVGAGSNSTHHDGTSKKATDSISAPTQPEDADAANSNGGGEGDSLGTVIHHNVEHSDSDIASLDEDVTSMYTMYVNSTLADEEAPGGLSPPPFHKASTATTGADHTDIPGASGSGATKEEDASSLTTERGTAPTISEKAWIDNEDIAKVAKENEVQEAEAEAEPDNSHTASDKEPSSQNIESSGTHTLVDFIESDEDLAKIEEKLVETSEEHVTSTDDESVEPSEGHGKAKEPIETSAVTLFETGDEHANTTGAELQIKAGTDHVETGKEATEPRDDNDVPSENEDDIDFNSIDVVGVTDSDEPSLIEEQIDLLLQQLNDDVDDAAALYNGENDNKNHRGMTMSAEQMRVQRSRPIGLPHFSAAEIEYHISNVFEPSLPVIEEEDEAEDEVSATTTTDAADTGNTSANNISNATTTTTSAGVNTTTTMDSRKPSGLDAMDEKWEAMSTDTSVSTPLSDEQLSEISYKGAEAYENAVTAAVAIAEEERKPVLEAEAEIEEEFEEKADIKADDHNDEKERVATDIKVVDEKMEKVVPADIKVDDEKMEAIPTDIKVDEMVIEKEIPADIKAQDEKTESAIPTDIKVDEKTAEKETVAADIKAHGDKQQITHASKESSEAIETAAATDATEDDEETAKQKKAAAELLAAQQAAVKQAYEDYYASNNNSDDDELVGWEMDKFASEAALFERAPGEPIKVNIPSADMDKRNPLPFCADPYPPSPFAEIESALEWAQTAAIFTPPERFEPLFIWRYREAPAVPAGFAQTTARYGMRDYR